MNWQQQITNYEPTNEQEVVDKQLFLKCMQTFDQILTRENEIAHVTCSAFVVNKARTKVLMVHHNIYQSWSWTGGHADGETDFLSVALREVQEETGVCHLQPVTPNIYSLDVLTVVGHMKKGKFISPHLHLNVAYLIEADEEHALTIAKEENSGVAWLPIGKIDDYSNEEHMKPIYHKIIAKMNA